MRVAQTVKVVQSRWVKGVRYAPMKEMEKGEDIAYKDGDDKTTMAGLWVGGVLEE